MARTIPSPTSGRTIPTPAAGGGNQNPWVDWVELPLNPTDGWTRRQGATDGQYCTAVKSVDGSGDLLTVEMHGNGGTGVNGSFRMTGATKDGFFLIRNEYIDVWNIANLVKPGSQPNQMVEPEKFLIKLEVTFDTVPITGPPGPGAPDWGNVLQVDAGICHYAADQSGSPALPGNDENLAASMWKAGTDPTVSGNAFSAGFNNYSGQGYDWAKFKCQSGHEVTGCDAIVWYCAVPLRAAKVASQSMLCGAYSTTDSFGEVVMDGNTNNSITGFLNDRYLHFYLGFGAYVAGATRGTIKIRRIRYICQPLTGRLGLTPA